MRQCPKCEYVDPPYWRPRIFDYEIDLIRLQELDNLDHALAARLKPGLTVIEGYYAYKLMSKTKYVYRLWLPIYMARGGWKMPKGYYDVRHTLNQSPAGYKKYVGMKGKLKNEMEKYLER